MRKNMGLYRGKRKDTGEWVEGNLFENDNAHFPMVLIGHVIMSRNKHTNELSFDGFNLCEVDPETVGQYTGKTDIGGEEIFEGDIVTYNDCYNSPVKGIIRYCAPEFLVDVPGRFAHHHRLIDSEDIRDAQVSFTAKYEYKVIGNIHDNQELLEVK